MGTDKIFVNKEYLKNIPPGLNEFFETKKFCDITLKVDEQIFPAHRIILISASDYFNNMLTGDFMESNRKTIELHELNADALQIILKYIYTGKLSLNSENVIDVLKAADFLQLTWPKNECSSYLEKCLCIENCLAIWKIAWKICCEDLQCEATKTVLKHLKVLLKTEELLELTHDEIKELFKNNQIAAENIYTAFITWVKHDLPERKGYLISLLKTLKTRQLSEYFCVSNIFTESVIREDKACVNWILDNFSLAGRENISNESKGNYTKPYDDKVFVCAVWDGSNCQEYDFDNPVLRTLTTRPTIKQFYPVFYQGCIYFICGESNHDFVQKMSVYNIQLNEWKEIPLELQRNEPAACVVDDAIYIAGGSKYSQPFKTLMRYDLNTGKLTSEKLMQSERYDISASVHGKCIYVCGGRPFDSIERYDIREGQWTVLPKTENSLDNCVSAVIFDEMYCAEIHKKSIEKYDIRRNEWEKLKDLPGSNNKLVAVKDKLYSFCSGGVSSYDRDSDTWSTEFVDFENYPFPVYQG